MDAPESERIVADASLFGGKPCMKGSRISVSVAFILELVAGGASLDSIHQAYPHLPPEALAATAFFAAGQEERDILRALALGDQEIRVGERVELDSVLAEADDILGR